MKLIVLITLLVVADEVGDSNLQDEAQEAWKFACEWSQYDCSEVPLPTIHMYMPEGVVARGTIRDEGIYISPYLIPGVDRKSTMMHEMVHWIQSYHGLPMEAYWGTPEMELLCKSEEEAFSVVDTWWRAIGMSDRQRGENWWWPYAHCYEFYDPDWEEFLLWLDTIFGEPTISPL